MYCVTKTKKFLQILLFVWIEFVSDTTTGLNSKWEVTETCHCIESGFN